MSERDEALLHAKLASFKRRLQEAITTVKEGLRACKTPYVACSFGKDSAVLLHMVLEQRPNIEVRFMRWMGESDLLHDYQRVIAEWRNSYKINLRIVEMERSSIDERTADRWNNFQQNADGYFIGFRAEESKGRRITLAKDGSIYKKADGLIRIAPLAWWKVSDVAAYIVTRNLPTLSSYTLEGFGMRTTARVPRDDYGIRAASLAALKLRSPESFNHLCKKFPEIRNYV